MRRIAASTAHHASIKSCGQQGGCIGLHRVDRLMRRAGLQARTRRPFRPCKSASRGAHGVANNLLQQEFKPPEPNRCWAGDITYIRTKAGWRYLAVSIDLFSRRMVGWKLDELMDAALVIEALKRALGQRQVKAEQLLIHTDQGSQYRATDYRELLKKHQIHCSMSAKSCYWDNAVVESFFSTLKLELALDDNRKERLDPKRLQRDLAFWIEGYYNRERRHSTIGYLSPIDYEQQFTVAHKLTVTGL